METPRPSPLQLRLMRLEAEIKAGARPRELAKLRAQTKILRFLLARGWDSREQGAPLATFPLFFPFCSPRAKPRPERERRTTLLKRIARLCRESRRRPSDWSWKLDDWLQESAAHESRVREKGQKHE